MLSVTKTPESAIGTTGFISRWLATDAPIEFWAQRKDNLISASVSVAGLTRITISPDNSIFFPEVDEYITVHTTSGAYLIAKVTAVAGNNYTLDLAYNANLVFDFMVAHQKKVSYFVEVRLTVNGQVLANTLRFTPNLNGLVKCDVSGYLQSYVSDDKQGTTGITASIKESSQSGKFLFGIRENYVGAPSSSYTVLPNEWFYCKGTRSVEKGTNLVEFVPNLGAEAKFLNYFDRPLLYRGMPFDLSFIYSELLNGKSLQIVEEHYDASNTMISTSTRDISTEQEEGLNTLILDTVNLEPTCEYIKVKVVTDDANPPVVQDTWYITSFPWSPSRPLTFVKSGTSVHVTGYHAHGSESVNVPDVGLIPSSPVTMTSQANITVTQADFAYLKSQFVGWFVEDGFGTMLTEDSMMSLWVISSRGYVTQVNMPVTSSDVANAASMRAKLNQLISYAATLCNFNGGLTNKFTGVEETINGNTFIVLRDTENKPLNVIWSVPFSLSKTSYIINSQPLTVPTFSVTFDGTLTLAEISTAGVVKSWDMISLPVDFVNFTNPEGLPIDTTYSL